MTLKPTQQIYTSALKGLIKDLVSARLTVKAYKEEVDEMKPEDFDFSEELEPGSEEKEEISEGPDEKFEEEEEEEGEGEEEGEEGEEKGKKPKIKTPEEAKKALEQCKKDLDEVIEHLDDVSGAAEEGKATASKGRISATFTANMPQLCTQAERVLDDAADALNHWSFLKRKYNPTSSIKNPKIKDAIATIKEVKEASNLFTRLFGGKKEAKQVTSTGVPPTGAKFTGDKWPDGKNPAEVELRHWHKGAEEFDRDKKFEDARPNSAIEDRLNDIEYQHNDKPFVNATRGLLDPTKTGSAYWDIFDSKSGKRIVATFTGTPADLGPKTENTLREFRSNAYGNKVIARIGQIGIEKVATELNAKFYPITKASLQVIAGEEGKGSLRKYYTDAFGDSGYAAKMTSGGGASRDMKGEIGYKPEHEDPNTKTDKTKDGPGKISSRRIAWKKEEEDEDEKKEKKEASQDPTIVAAKARRSVEASKVFASRGLIKFTVPAIFKKAQELTSMGDTAFKEVMASITQLPIVYGYALQATAHIPDTEYGIVGNTREGVRDPNAEVQTEDMEGDIKGDAKIKKNASRSFIPQGYVDNSVNGLKINTQFRTVESQLQAKGVDLTKIRKAKYVGDSRTS